MLSYVKVREFLTMGIALESLYEILQIAQGDL